MTTFAQDKSSPSDKKTKKRLIYLAAIVHVLFFALIFTVKETSVYFPAIFVLLAVSIALMLAYFLMGDLDRIGKVQFVNIDEEKIEWFEQRKNLPALNIVEWNDVHWIKKENDGTVSFFVASSICHNLRINDFPESDQENITSLVVGYARRQKIRLVNFSEAVLATA